MHIKGEEFLKICRDRYYDNPILFAEEVVGIKLSSQQGPVLEALSNSKEKKVAVKSGHGVGKSCLASIGVLWFLCTRDNARVIATAPSANQIYNVMMTEIRLWYNRSILSELDLFVFTKDKIRLNHSMFYNTWYLSAVSVANPENISGGHADNILAIVDEGAGVDDEIFIRLEGVLTTEGSYLLTLGNPSFDSGYFYDIFHKEEYMKQYSLFTLSCVESTNVDADWVEYMKDKYGEDSNVYKVRVLGEFAPLDVETVIRREDIVACLSRTVNDIDKKKCFFGIDVSSGEGNDFSVISIRSNHTEIERLKVKKNLSDLQKLIIKKVYKTLETFKHVVVNIDTTGLGIQLGQDLKTEFELVHNVDINCINFSYRAIDYKKYSNTATEMFYVFKSKIENISLLDIKESTVDVDIANRRYLYDRTNRFIIEPKKNFIKRNGRSPDEGDAVLLAFYDIADARELRFENVKGGDW